MIEVGVIVFVQIQREPMKIHVGEKRIYRTDPLLRVKQLHLSPKGIQGITEEGYTLTDVHHSAHPNSRYRGDNSLSIGFLHHYVSMRQRFGSHITDGVAAENIIVKMNQQWFDVPLADQLLIRTHAGQDVVLMDITPATPCVEFSQFCLRHESSASDLKDTLRFLDNGRRGYYAKSPGQDFLVQAGDILYLPEK